MRPDLFTISRGGRGRLSTMTRPRGGDWLTDELDDLAMAGVSVMVSLLSDAEAAELDLIHEADAAQAAGIEFHRLHAGHEVGPHLRHPDSGMTVRSPA